MSRDRLKKFFSLPSVTQIAVLALTIMIGTTGPVHAGLEGAVEGVLLRWFGNPGSYTTGQVPASNGKGGFTPTTVGVSFPLKAPNGSAAAPSYSSSSHTGSGIYFDTAGDVLASVLGANVLTTGPGTFSIAGGMQTVDNTPLQISETWNNAGVTFNCIEVNITNSASAAASLLVNYKVGGVEVFTIDEAGNVMLNGISFPTGTNAPQINGPTDNDLGIQSGSGKKIYITDGTNYVKCVVSGIELQGPTFMDNTLTQYNSIATETTAGLTVERTSGIITGQKVAQNICAYTPTSDTWFNVGAFLNITTFSSGSININVTYHDAETNTAQTLTLQSAKTSTYGTAAGSAGAWSCQSMVIHAKANTAVTIATAGTFTNLTYTASGYIESKSGG